MHTIEQVQTELIEILAKLLHLEPAHIKADDHIFDVLGLDSTGIIELLLALEGHFDIEFDMEELDPSYLETARALSSFIQTMRS